MSHLQFYRAILSRKKVARQNRAIKLRSKLLQERRVIWWASRVFTLLEVVGVVDVKVPAAYVRRWDVVRRNCGGLCLPKYRVAVDILIANVNYKPTTQHAVPCTPTLPHVWMSVRPRLCTLQYNNNYYLPHRRWWEVMFSPVFSVDIYVCEQLPGANSSLIVTKLGQGTRWLNFGRSRSKVKVGGEVCALLSHSSSHSIFSAIRMRCDIRQKASIVDR